MRWDELLPDPEMAHALDAADRNGPRKKAPSGDQDAKRDWSNRFADVCTQMVADALRRSTKLGKFDIRPRKDGSGKEALTFVAPARRRRWVSLLPLSRLGSKWAFRRKVSAFRSIRTISPAEPTNSWTRSERSTGLGGPANPLGCHNWRRHRRLRDSLRMCTRTSSS